jgi:hypothetical protein
VVVAIMRAMGKRKKRNAIASKDLLCHSGSSELILLFSRFLGERI